MTLLDFTKDFFLISVIIIVSEVVMARIIERESERRIIKMTTEDIISVVKDYQRIVPRGASAEQVRSYLEDCVIFIPEDL